MLIWRGHSVLKNLFSGGNGIYADDRNIKFIVSKHLAEGVQRSSEEGSQFSGTTFQGKWQLCSSLARTMGIHHRANSFAYKNISDINSYLMIISSLKWLFHVWIKSDYHAASFRAPLPPGITGTWYRMNRNLRAFHNQQQRGVACARTSVLKLCGTDDQWPSS